MKMKSWFLCTRDNHNNIYTHFSILFLFGEAWAFIWRSRAAAGIRGWGTYKPLRGKTRVAGAAVSVCTLCARRAFIGIAAVWVHAVLDVSTFVVAFSATYMELWRVTWLLNMTGDIGAWGSNSLTGDAVGFSHLACGGGRMGESCPSSKTVPRISFREEDRIAITASKTSSVWLTLRSAQSDSSMMIMMAVSCFA